MARPAHTSEHSAVLASAYPCCDRLGWAECRRRTQGERQDLSRLLHQSFAIIAGFVKQRQLKVVAAHYKIASGSAIVLEQRDTNGLRATHF